MGQAAFLLALMVAVYVKRSLDFTNAEIRFGLYTALAAAAIGTFSAYALKEKVEKRDVQQFFGQNETPAEEEAGTTTVDEIEPEIEEAKTEASEPVSQSSHFMREAGLRQEAEENETQKEDPTLNF